LIAWSTSVTLSGDVNGVLSATTAYLSGLNDGTITATLRSQPTSGTRLALLLLLLASAEIRCSGRLTSSRAIPAALIS